MTKADLSKLSGLALLAGRGAVAVSALTLVLAACASPGNASHPARPASGSASTGSEQGATFKGTTYKGTIYVSSQAFDTPHSWHVTRTFTEQLKNATNCAAAARGQHSVFLVPSAKAPLPEDHIQITGFHGPGTYPPNVMKHDKLDMILMPGKSGPRQYDITISGHGRKPGREALFLNPNGSGQLVYADAHLDGKASGPAVAGLISWTCTS